MMKVRRLAAGFTSSQAAGGRIPLEYAMANLTCATATNGDQSVLPARPTSSRRRTFRSTKRKQGRHREGEGCWVSSSLLRFVCAANSFAAGTRRTRQSMYAAV